MGTEDRKRPKIIKSERTNERTDRPISPVSIFSCIENGSFRSIFRAQLARKNLHKNIRTKKCQKVALQKGEFWWKNQISYGEFLGKWDFKKTSFVCVWDFKVFDFWVFSFWKTCCNLTSYRESQYTKVHLYFTCNKSELAILEFTLLEPLFSNSLLPLSNLDFTGEFCQIMIAQIVWYARKELNKKKVEIFHQEFLWSYCQKNWK